ncbi:MAG: 16S rRNA processing protein RimM [Clostridia bacterium]|jgi:16S rRNA processing protein RimM|nr:16S rRNA processing protein RimM [Clostridia bacterium]
MKRFLEAGRLNSPRGLKGELRFDCWCDGIDFLSGVKYLYLDNEGKRRLEVKAFRETVSTVIFVGYEERETAASLTGRIVYFDREDITLPEGVFYNDDLIGATVTDEITGNTVGVLKRIEEGVASDLYFIEGEKKYIVPAVEEFIVSASPSGIIIRLIDGFEA